MSKVTNPERLAGPVSQAGFKRWLKRWGWLIVVLLHAVGVAGMAYPPSRELFKMLTPAHLMIMCLLLFWTDEQPLSRKLTYVGGAAFLGFSAEVLGVAKGWLFGTYVYGDGLGLKWMDVPFLIGINWALLAYGAGWVVSGLRRSLFEKAALAALLLVGLDACMEPAAVGMGLWSWPGGLVPGQNYLGWWVTGLPICFWRQYVLPGEGSPLTGWVWWCQFVFFFVLSWLVFPVI